MGGLDHGEDEGSTLRPLVGKELKWRRMRTEDEGDEVGNLSLVLMIE